MDYYRHKTSLLLLLLYGVCLSAAQDGGRRLTATVGGAITFPATVLTDGSILSYNGHVIAAVVNGKINAAYNKDFTGRLQWDHQTGLFTIRELKTKDSGVYKVQPGDGGTVLSFQLSVYNVVPKPQVRSVGNGSCVVECSVENGREVTLSWYRGEERLNQTSSADLSSRLLLLQWVEGNSSSVYSCVAHNPVSDQNTTVNTTELCKVPHKEEDILRSWGPIIIALVCAAACVIVVVVGLLVYLRMKRGRASKHVPGSAGSGLDDVLYAAVTPTDSRDDQGGVSDLDAVMTTVEYRIRSVSSAG